MNKYTLLSCLLAGETLGYAQSKEEKVLQDCGLSYPNLQACSWELLLVLKAEFSFFLTPKGFGLSPSQ